VLGGGFAGVNTAQQLVKALRGKDDVEIELLSDTNYFVFQPLLPEVAAGGIAPIHVVSPIRELIVGAKFRLCRIRSVDAENHRVLVTQGEGRALVSVRYDHLVFALGKVPNSRAFPGVAEHALGLKNLGDAFRLRSHVLRSLELAAIQDDPAQRRALLTFVVAGAGFSGVETTGELWELVMRALRYFPNIDRREVHFVLAYSSNTVLPEMMSDLGQAAERVLRRRGIQLMPGVRVRAASRARVFLSDGRVLETRTFVSTVGNMPNPVARHALSAQGFHEAESDGRRLGTFATDEQLRCVGRPGHWALGDCAGVPRAEGGLCPPTAQYAVRQARVCARNIAATLEGRAPKPFRFRPLGSLASLGQRRAVAQIPGVCLTGFFAWFLWRTIYLMKLPGLVRRLRVAFDWTLDLFFPRDITQLDVSRAERFSIEHYEPDENIVCAGEVGAEFYVIVSGVVEVLGASGNEVIAELGPKDVFGERALLDDTRRTASVRAKTAVDVLSMTRRDFRTLAEHLPALESYLEQLRVERNGSDNEPEPARERPRLENEPRVNPFEQR